MYTRRGSAADQRNVITSAAARSRTASVEALELCDFLRRELCQVEISPSIAPDTVRAVDRATAAADQASVRTKQADARDLVGNKYQVAIVDPDLHGVIEVAPRGEEVPF